MKVIHSVPSIALRGGGPSRSVSELCAALTGKCQVGLVTARCSGDEEVTLHSKVNLKAIRADMYGMGGRFLARSFAKPLAELVTKSDKQTLIHQHGIWLKSSHQTTRFAHRSGLPLIVSPRGMMEPWAMENSRWKKKLAWFLFQRSDLRKATGFHATAESEAESIRALGFEQPIAVIANGIEFGGGEVVHAHRPSHPPESSTKEPFGQIRGGGRKNLLFLSRINPKKGLLMLLSAWKLVNDQSWELIIAGNDDSGHLPEVEQKIQELDLHGSVRVVGPLYGKEKDEAFEKADLFVLPSFSENFGIVVIEALSKNVPVLTTKGCPWAELETRGCGWWVDATIEGLEAGLKEALATPEDKLKMMGAFGKKLVEEKYLWPGIAEKMYTYYRWLVSGGDKPDFVLQ